MRGFLVEEHMSIAALPSARDMALTSELEDLYREHHELIYRTAYSVTGSRPDAEDVLQIIFLRLLRRGLPRDLERNPKGYLYRAAVNVSLNTLRNRKRRTAKEDVEPMLVAVHPAGENRREESRRRLLDAIARLQPRAVEILILRHVHEYSDAEIARMLGTTRGTVAVALYRARARLRTLLGHVTSTSAEASADKPGGMR
jgi:RNA polymerase sigma factor (sigma-70 family)